MGGGGTENFAFTDRVIRKLQTMSIADGLFAVTLNAYLMDRGRLAFDAERSLFWVVPPQGQPQVAVWMI